MSISALHAVLEAGLRGAMAPPGSQGLLRIRVDDDRGVLVEDLWIQIGAPCALLSSAPAEQPDATLYLSPTQASALLGSDGPQQALRVAGDAALLSALARALSPTSTLGVRLGRR